MAAKPTPTATIPDDEAASVEPDRLFFIAMITKDVELIPAILDLWDNSIDAAMRFLPKEGKKGSLKDYRVDITITDDSFEISDNCGGITLDAARRKAFRLGRGKLDTGVDGAVGSFGVGMKRSLFKIGRNFAVESKSIDGAFQLEVDVTAWQDQQGAWRFPFSHSDPKFHGKAPKETSTSIKVTNLYESISKQFATPTFRTRLDAELRMRRPEAYEYGITTALNKKELKPLALILAFGPEIAPLVQRQEVAPGVLVTLRAGMGIAEASDPDDDGDATKFIGRDEAGWYVLANGRVLLAAEKTRLTGWGDDVGRYHPQYRNFRGYVDIRAIDGRALPWNTTKTSVDEDSEIWRKVYGMMRLALVEVQTLLNRVKSEVQNEKATGVVGPVSAAITKSAAVAIESIPVNGNSALKYPKVAPPPKVTSKAITFRVEAARFDAVAAHMGEKSAPEVGRRVFTYYEKMELE